MDTVEQPRRGAARQPRDGRRPRTTGAQANRTDPAHQVLWPPDEDQVRLSDRPPKGRAASLAVCG